MKIAASHVPFAIPFDYPIWALRLVRNHLALTHWYLVVPSNMGRV